MATKKIPISFNDYDQKILKELSQILGIADLYGDIPKAVKFGIKLALSAIKNPQKVYSGLNTDEMKLYFSSIANWEIERRSRELAKQYLKDNQKSITQYPKKV